MMYDLPTSIEIGGVSYEIRSDYRAALDIFAALSDTELSDADKAAVVLDIFYPGFADMPPEHYEEAIKQCFWFLDCGDVPDTRKAPKVMDWEQDFKYLVAPVNRVIGKEIRAVEYLHWWSFIAAYYEIGDCLFAQIVSVRDKLARGKKLEKAERDWYNRNRALVDIKTKYTDAEDSLVRQLLGK